MKDAPPAVTDPDSDSHPDSASALALQGAGAAPPRSPRRRWRRRILLGLALFAVLLGIARLWPAPADQRLERPRRASRTAYPERDLVVDGVRLRYLDLGPRDAAEPPLLLLLGHTSRVEELEALYPLLSRTRRVLSFDFPGSGYSEKPARSYGLEDYEVATLHFLDALGIARANLGGGSLGGNLTLRLGRRAPERFERLVPWSPGSAWPARPRSAAAIRAAACYALFVPTVRIQSTYWYDRDWPGREAALRDTFSYYDDVLSPGFIAMYWGLAADTVEKSLFDVAAGVPLPTLLLWGDQDQTPGMADGVRRIHDLLPRSELRTYEGAPHALASHMPEVLAEAIDEFLRRPAERLP